MPGLTDRAARNSELLAIDAEENSTPVRQLSTREREVLGLVARGLSNPRIGRELQISAGTVRTHVEHILAKLGVGNRTQAAVKAVELGLISG